MYDRNGLELSPVSNQTMNTYKMTTVDLKEKKYKAYAARHSHYTGEMFAMMPIRAYKDPRDAAYVGQQFAKLYDKFKVRDMSDAGEFREICNDFLENLEIPEWEFPAEGLSIEDILGGNGYKVNYVSNAKDALIEYIKISGMKPPGLDKIKNLIQQVETLYKSGLSHREAAAKTLQEG